MKSPKAEVNSKAKQRNHHLPVDHGCSSHMLTSTIIAKESTTQQNTQQ